MGMCRGRGGREVRCLVGSFGVSFTEWQGSGGLGPLIGPPHTKEKGQGGRRRGEGGKGGEFWTDGRR